MSEFTEPASEEVADEVAAMFDLTQKKKKKKPKKADVATEGEVTKGAAETEGAVVGEASSSSSQGVFELDPPNYSYSQLLNRVVDFIHQNNPELTDKKRFMMKPPQLMRGSENNIPLCLF